MRRLAVDRRSDLHAPRWELTHQERVVNLLDAATGRWQGQRREQDVGRAWAGRGQGGVCEGAKVGPVLGGARTSQTDGSATLQRFGSSRRGTARRQARRACTFTVV